MASRPGEAGLTLIEMLIVLAILAVAAGAVTLGIGAATRAPSAESEARRFAQRLQAAADDALLGDRMIALIADEHQYGFAMHDGEGGWTPLADAMAMHELPGGMVMELSVRPPVVLGVDGSGRPMTATITSGGERWVVRYDGLTAAAFRAPPA